MFFWISDEKSLKNIKNEQKRLKTDKKVFQQFFGTHAPKFGQNTKHTSQIVYPPDAYQYQELKKILVWPKTKPQ